MGFSEPGPQVLGLVLLLGCTDEILELDRSSLGGEVPCASCMMCTEVGLGGGGGGDGGSGGSGPGGGGGGVAGRAGPGLGGPPTALCGGSPGGPITSGGALFAAGATGGCPRALGGGLGLSDSLGWGDGDGLTGSSFGGGGPPPEAGGPVPFASGLFDRDGNPVSLPSDLIDPFGDFGGPCCHVDCEGGPAPECASVCGDGVRDGLELCDGDCPVDCDDGDFCTFEQLFGDASFCLAACFRGPVGCRDGDGCCTESSLLTGICNNLNDDDCPVPTGDVGSPCADDGQCLRAGDVTSGVACLPARFSDRDRGSAAVFTGGYCTRTDCGMAGCPVGSDCVGSRSIAYDSAFAFSEICLAECDSDADCRDFGYACQDVDGDGARECYLAGTGTAPIGTPCSGAFVCAGGPGVRCADPATLPGGFDDGRGPICTRLCDDFEPDFPACPAGYVCPVAGNVCLPAPPPENFGGPCTANADCGGPGVNRNRCLQEAQGFNGGLCTTGSSDADCPAGARFVFGLDFSRERPLVTGCLRECTSDADCRNGVGYACIDPGDGMGQVCAAVFDGEGDLGSECRGSWDCDGARGHLCDSGICRQDCTSTGSPCPTDVACIAGVCRPSCSNDVDCPRGERCLVDPRSQAGVCL